MTGGLLVVFVRLGAGRERRGKKGHAEHGRCCFKNVILMFSFLIVRDAVVEALVGPSALRLRLECPRSHLVSRPTWSRAPA